MIPEVADLVQVWKTIRGSVEQMLAELSDEQWERKPEGNNAIAAVIEHVALVEKMFLSAIAGQPGPGDVQAPFKASSWSAAQARQQWQESLAFGERVLANVQPEQLSEFALKLRFGELNKRQALAYMIAHTDHHRGQIPLLKRML
ncbi:MAG: DinB family protein [Alicyclobacillus sp.]|nr:DinB family protein [Alicyclobacillus sp.]